MPDLVPDFVPDFVIEEIPRPTTLEGEAGALFTAVVEVHNAVEVAGYRIPEVATTSSEFLPQLLDPAMERRWFVARVDERVVGYGEVRSLLEAPEVGWYDVRILPAFVDRGIEAALSSELEAVSRSAGQTRVVQYVVHPDAAGPRLAAPTGFGDIPADDRMARFLLDQGWTLEQIARGSRFPLPGDATLLAAARADAEAHAGDYRLLQWAGSTPEEWREAVALLNTLMSTDAPTAATGEPEDVWDVDRLVANEELLLASPQTFLVSAAEHRASGALVGITQLVVPDDVERAVSQWETIVLAEHRGHRLGMLLKTANLQFLEREAPGHPSVLTWNAEENRPMLAVNGAVGFVPIGYEGVWAKTLA